jgi:hypothetical protein
MTLRGERIAEEFQALVLNYVQQRYAKSTASATTAAD